MREDQIEAIERLQREHFPNGIAVLAPMKDGSLHTYLTPHEGGEFLQLLDLLTIDAIDQVERMQREARDGDDG